MFMETGALRSVSVNTIADTFNKAFADYVVDVQMTPEQMESKIRSENIRPEISAAVFEEGVPVGMVLMAEGYVNGIKTAYNAGTGVVPNRRGRGLTKEIYRYLIPILRQKGFEQLTLEVISTNAPAIAVYKSLGYSTIREMDCFFGTVISEWNGIDIRSVNPAELDYDLLKSFHDWSPSWQNSDHCIRRFGREVNSITVKEGNELKGQSIKCSSQLGVINVDSSSYATLKFLNSLGMQSKLMQFEMRLGLR